MYMHIAIKLSAEILNFNFANSSMCALRVLYEIELCRFNFRNLRGKFVKFATLDKTTSMVYAVVFHSLVTTSEP